MQKNRENYNVIIVGAGAAGMMAAIASGRRGKKVLLLEKLSKPGAKLKATGGGRCNLTNTLDNDDFMARFGRHGRFMTTALKHFDHNALISFFAGIGVNSHAPDGYRVFPLSHDSAEIITALEEEMRRIGIELKCGQRVENIEFSGTHVTGVSTSDRVYTSANVIIATGGLGYPQLGAEGDGYEMAKSVGHKIAELYPAMMPLRTRETWVQNCRADTIPKAQIRVDLPKAKKLHATGDLIFTATGIRGPVVLDFARELSPLLEKYGEVPLLVNMTRGMNEEEILTHIKNMAAEKHGKSIPELLSGLLPESVARELCIEAGADMHSSFKKLEGEVRQKLIRLLAWTPLTVVGHDGFKTAMITRGGVSLKEIDPETMQSRLLKGLFFCGEVVDLDGPCGGYNLQWSFASGFLAGHLAEEFDLKI